jgi:hypothetical protein
MHAVNKVLSFDILHQYKSPAAMCVNDAKSCYNLVLSFLNMVMQSKGVVEEPLVCMVTTLENLESKIRMVYSNSDDTYGGSLWAVPLFGEEQGDKCEGPQHGIGQGNGATPTCWAVVSTPMLDVMRVEGFTTYFKALISNEEILFKWALHSLMIPIS